MSVGVELVSIPVCLRAVLYVGVDRNTCMHARMHSQLTNGPLRTKSSSCCCVHTHLTALLEHTMTSCPFNAHLCSSPSSLGPLTACFVPWQIYSSWLHYRALGNGDTNVTVSAVSRSKTSAVACGNEQQWGHWHHSGLDRTTQYKTNQTHSRHTAKLDVMNLALFSTAQCI